MPVPAVERMARHDRCSSPRDKLARSPNPDDARDEKGHAMKFGISEPLTRKEDDALLRGAGRYVADVAPAGGPAVSAGAPRHKVVHVGDAVAFIVADTLDQARDAAEAVAIDYRPLPCVVDAVAALRPGAPLVWPDKAGNVAFARTLGDEARTRDAFGRAAKTVELKVVNQRLVTNFMDTRACVAEYDRAGDRLTLTLGSQGSHLIRDILAEQVLKIPADKLRVITPDVGGGFGTKYFPYREYALVAVAAKRLGRPVKWVAERGEHFLADAQGRDNVTTARLALDSTGKFLALSIDTVCDMGAYLSTFAPYIPYVGAVMLPGVYDFAAAFIRITAAHTNTLPVDAYRGAGRPEAAYVIERLVDTAARELGLTPEALRRKNFIKPKQMPYTTPTGQTYDTGDFAAHLARAQDVADWKGFSKRLPAAKKGKKRRGIGFSTYIEACGNNGPEAATLRLGEDGAVTVLIGSPTTRPSPPTPHPPPLPRPPPPC